VSKVDPRWVRDSLVEDLVKPAHEAGKPVDVAAGEDYIVGVLEKLERKRSERKATPAKTETKSKTDDEFKRRTGRELDPNWKPDTGRQSVVRQDQVRLVGEHLLVQRLRWIRQRPELFAQVKHLAVALNSGNQATRENAAQQMRAFIAKTDKWAGHRWDAPKGKKLMFSG